MNFVFDPSLVLYLPLYELDGSSFASRDAYGHLCTVTGALWRPNGHYFDGADDRIAVADSAGSAFDLITAMTYEVWVKPGNGGDNYGRFLSKTDANPYANRKVMLGKELADETNVRWEHSDLAGGGVLNSGAGAMVVDAWNHVVGTYENSGQKFIYVNGASVASATQAGTVASTAGGVLWIGSLFATNQNFLGDIGEVRIYNRGLTPQEIQHNYLATKWRYR